jgi:hypothetical protein
MPSTTATPTRVGVYIAHDQDYYHSRLGDPDVIADERSHIANGSWSAYVLMTVVECPHCGRLFITDSLGGVVVDTTTLAGSVVWDDDPSLGQADVDYLSWQIHGLIQIERAHPTPPAGWVPLHRAAP